MTKPRDPGLQPERTALAWKRTALAMAVNALLVMRTGLQGHARALMLAGVGLGGVAVMLMAASVLRRRQLTAGPPMAPRQALLALTSVAVLLAAACACWSMLQ